MSQKITDLAEVAVEELLDTDIMYLVIPGDGTPDRKISLEALKEYIQVAISGLPDRPIEEVTDEDILQLVVDDTDPNRKITVGTIVAYVIQTIEEMSS